MKKKFLIGTIIWFAVSLVIIAADQIIKNNILNSRSVGEIFGELPGICDFIFVKNTGAAFSSFSGNTLMLSIISIVFAIAVIVFWIWKKPQNKMLQLSMSLIFAGAVGNGIDRIAYGFVVDFISIKWFDFPVFNIADMAIVAGAILLVLYEVIFDRSDEESKNE